MFRHVLKSPPLNKILGFQDQKKRLLQKRKLLQKTSTKKKTSNQKSK